MNIFLLLNDIHFFQNSTPPLLPFTTMLHNFLLCLDNLCWPTNKRQLSWKNLTKNKSLSRLYLLFKTFLCQLLLLLLLLYYIYFTQSFNINGYILNDKLCLVSFSRGSAAVVITTTVHSYIQYIYNMYYVVCCGDAECRLKSVVALVSSLVTAIFRLLSALLRPGTLSGRGTTECSRLVYATEGN